MASNSQILEGLWGLGVPQATVAGAPADASYGAFVDELHRRGITDDQISRAQALADWRPDKKNAGSRAGLGSLLKILNVPQDRINQIIHGVVENPDGSPKNYTDTDLVRAVSDALGPQVATNMAIKLGAPTAIPQGAPAWNPFRGDQPPAPPPAPAPAPLAGAGPLQPGQTYAAPAPAPTPTIPTARPAAPGAGASAARAGRTTPAPAATPSPQIGVGQGASLADQKQYVRSHYGYLAGWLDDPEVGPKLEQAAIQGWDMARLEGELSTTNWWKTHDATQRLKQNENLTDPATYGLGVTGKKTEIQAEAGRQGVTIDPDRLNQMATDAYTHGWKPNEVTQNVAAEFHYDPKAAKQPGEVGNLKQIASSYLVPIDDTTIQQWGGDIMSGRSNDQAFTEYIKGQAKSLFPTMSAAIDAGQTVAQYVAPYKSTIAQTLELDPNAIDFMDPKYMKLLTSIDPKTNAPVAKPLYQTLDDIRKDPVYGYQYTSQAKDQAASFSTQLAQTWGLM